jgi:hypothetical protein
VLFPWPQSDPGEVGDFAELHDFVGSRKNCEYETAKVGSVL